MSELYPGSCQMPPMRCANTPVQSKVDSAFKSDKWVMQNKYDGAWYQLEKTDDGEIYLFGRTLSKVTGEYTEKISNVPWLKEWAKYLPNGTILIGEIYIPNGHSNDVTKIMGCLPKKAIERQKNVNVQYIVFDCIKYDGKVLCKEPFSARFGEYVCYFLLDLFKDGHVKVADTWTLDGSIGEQTDSYADILSSIFKSNGEGAVIKHKDSIYRPGMRTTANQTFKIKEHIDSVDLVVMDTLDPEMKYTGKELEVWPYWVERSEFDASGSYSWIKCDGSRYEDSKTNPHIFKPVTKPYYYGWKNALRLGAYNNDGELVEVCRVASGLTDELREELGKNPEKYINSVCEISCMSLNKQDFTVRHPVFERFRDDKDKSECLLHEIF